jgi:hypothetical protein
MKSFILSIALLLSTAQLTFGRCAPQAFYTTVHTMPVMVYGTITGCKTDKTTGMTTANLAILETLKGELSEGKMIVRQLKVSFASEIGGSVPQKPNVKNGDKKIFFLERNKDKSWRLVVGRCMTYQLAVNANKEIILSNYDNKTVSFDDFKNGIALFNKNYSDFEAKKAENTDFKLENSAKNTTFALLAGEMLGKTFETFDKPSKKRKNKKRK